MEWHELGEPALVEELRQLIARRGPIPFSDFMEVALYHPTLGYYMGTRPKLGASGDFFTSPELHPAFGTLLGEQLEEVWEVLGRPRDFAVVEAGGGNGWLARDILTHSQRLPEAFARALRYVVTEPSPYLVEVQQQCLADFRWRVIWADSLRGFPPAEAGCVLANEVLDAFPVHVVEKRAGYLLEVLVGLRDGRFVEVVAEPSTPQLEAYFGWLGVDLPDGCRGEANLRALHWLEDAAGALRRGVIFIVDYGGTAQDRYGPKRARGTVMSYYRHTAIDDPYVLVGHQDITAHVDFTALQRKAAELGLRQLALVSQRDFLTNLGLGSYLEWVRSASLPAAERRVASLALEELVRAGGLGDFMVLALGKDMPAGFRLRGLRAEAAAAGPVVPPTAETVRPRLASALAGQQEHLARLWHDLLR